MPIRLLFIQLLRMKQLVLPSSLIPESLFPQSGPALYILRFSMMTLFDVMFTTVPISSPSIIASPSPVSVRVLLTVMCSW